jgi:hypothetical protein
MRAMVYRTAASSPSLLRCLYCGAASSTTPECNDCALVLRQECWSGVRLGLRLSPLLAAGVAPALAFGERALTLLAATVWLLGPFAWALFFGNRPGVRSRERARGVALVHTACVVVALVGLAACAMGAPFVD